MPLILVTTIIIFGAYSVWFGIETLTGQRSGATVPGRGTPGALIGARVTSMMGSISDLLEKAFARAFPHRAGRPGIAKAPWAISALILIFLLAPVVVLVPVSFTSASFIQWPPQGLSLRWYAAVLTSDVWRHAAFRSLTVGFLAAALSLVINLPAAMAVTRRRHAGQ